MLHAAAGRAVGPMSSCAVQRRPACPFPSAYRRRVACTHNASTLRQQQRRKACRHVPAAAAAATTEPTAAASGDAAAALLHSLLDGAAAAPSQLDRQPVEVEVVGRARHLGMDMEWWLSFSSDGSFVEELASPELSCSSGYAASPVAAGCGDAASSSTAASSSGSSGGSTYFRAPGECWGSDDTGCPRRLELDDSEAQLLAMWVRAGLWVLPHIAAQLRIAEASPEEAAAAYAADADADEEAGSAAAAAEDGSTWLHLRLRGGGRVTALLEVATADLRPLRLRLRLAGEHELWTFSDHREWQPGMWVAGAAAQATSGASGVTNEYLTASVALRPASVDAASGSSSSSRYAQPPTPLMPPDAVFLPGVPEDVPAWHTSSGHSLVRPRINGADVGYFILDSGASGFVLDPAAGDALGLPAFGELQVTSMVGRISSSFRRADTFELGPLRIQRPLLMELPMGGLVSGVPEGGRVVGIVGYDVLRRAVVHMPPPPRRAALAPGAAAVDSPAAAVAASVAAAALQRGAMPYNLRFQHPASPEDGASEAAAAEAPSTSSSGSAAGLSATMLAGNGSAAAVAAARATHAPSGSDSSSSSSSAASVGSRRRRRAAAEPAEPAARPPRQWLPVVMVSSLPHVELELLTTGGHIHRGLFMMDSGAGGLDIILNARAAAVMGLGPGSTPTAIKGIGAGGGNRLAARRCQLAEVRLGAHTFRGAQALYHESSSGGGGGLELSQHTSGIICGGLLSQCALTFDYARVRVGVQGPAAT